MTYLEAEARLQMCNLPAWRAMLADLLADHEALEQKLENAPAADLLVMVGRWKASRQFLNTLRNMPDDSRRIINEHHAALEKIV